MSIKYDQLNSEEQSKIRTAALEYYKIHKGSIMKRINSNTPKTAPSGSDLYSPTLWKESHWKWFLDNSFLL